MRGALIVFAVALAAHLTYFALDHESTAIDSHKYEVPAEAMLEGRGFVRGWIPEVIRTPGYPLFLAITKLAGCDARQIALVQHVLAALLAAVMFPLTRRLTGNVFISGVAAGFCALDLPTISHANLILTETIFTTGLVCAVWAVWRLAEEQRHGVPAFFMAGLLLGVLTMIRPVALLWFVPLAAYLIWARRDAWWRLVPLFVLGALLLPAAWRMRNERVTGLASISANGAVLLIDYHAPGAWAMEDPGDFWTNFERRRDEIRKVADQRAAAQWNVEDVAQLPYVARAESDTRLGGEIVRAHPLGFVKLFCFGFAVNLLGGNADALVRITGISRPVAQRLLLPWNALAVVLAALGARYLLAAERRRYGLLMLLTIVYFLATTAGAISYSRFRVPVVPLYAISVGAGAHLVREWLRSRARSTRPPAVPM